MKTTPTYQELEEELKIIKANEKSKETLDFPKTLYISIDIYGKVISVNKKTCEVLGYKEHEIIGKDWFDSFVPEKEKTAVLTVSQKLLSGKDKIPNENSIVTKSGEERIIYWHNALTKDENGVITGHLSSGEDITERKENDIILREQREKLKKAQQVADMGFLDWNFKTNKIELSESVVKLYGLESNTKFINSDDLVKMVHPDDLKLVQKNLEQAVKKEKQYNIDHRLIRPDGETIWVQAQGNLDYDSEGNPKGFLGTVVEITERKKSELALIESELNFNAFTNQSSEGISVADLKGNYTFVNPAFCEMVGYTENELLKMNVTDVSADPFDTTTFDKTRTSMESKPVMVKLLRKNKSTFIAEVTGKNLLINGKKSVLGTIRDITEQETAKQQLKESERLLKESQKIAKIGYWQLDHINSSLTWSDEVFRIFNLKPQEFKPTYASFLDNVHPKDRDKVNNTYIDSLSNKKPYEITHRLLLNSNKIKYVADKCITEFTNEGKPIRSLGTVQDITESKQAELKLAKSRDEVKASEQKFRQLFEKSSDAIVINKNNKLLDINNAGIKMFGFTSKNEFFNFHAAKLSPKFQPDGRDSFEKAEEMYDLVYKNGAHRFEWTHKKKNGEIFSVDIMLTSISTEPKNKIVHTVLRDITDRKLIELELEEAKKKAEESDRLKTEFISNMSHEIRTPMNGIMGFSELLSDRDLGDEKRKYFVNIIKNSGKQLLQIIDDIIEISKLGTKQVKVYEDKVVLNDLLLELFSIFDSKAKENKTPLYLNVGLSDKKSTVLIDSTKLNKILSNLLENALKFTNIGTIELGYNLINSNKSPMLEIYVKDTGVGIKPEDQKLIFERFARAGNETIKKVKGLGLGLSIAKENALLLNGEINVESNKGKGTTFFIKIPYKPVFIEDEIEDFEEKHVFLIVEDEEVNYLYISTLLVDVLKINCTILHAKNGKEAIEICKSNPVIDLILMDLKMPVMSGFDASKEISKHYPTIPIIAQTAYSTKEEEQKARDSGCSDFISKPISKETLYTVIKKFVPQV